MAKAGVKKNNTDNSIGATVRFAPQVFIGGYLNHRIVSGSETHGICGF